MLDFLAGALEAAWEEEGAIDGRLVVGGDGFCVGLRLVLADGLDSAARGAAVLEEGAAFVVAAALGRGVALGVGTGCETMLAIPEARVKRPWFGEHVK